MEERGLLKKPEWNNAKEYLKSAARTEVTEKILQATNDIEGKKPRKIIQGILDLMKEQTERLSNSKDERKFKRTATEILESKERTGCCDSCTLFAALARSKGIPTMQIIAFDKSNKAEDGHYFAACYLKESDEQCRWFLIDPDVRKKKAMEAEKQDKIEKQDKVEIKRLDENNRNIKGSFYAFAYVKDYSELGIDCIKKMKTIQYEAYEKCNKEDFEEREDIR